MELAEKLNVWPCLHATRPDSVVNTIVLSGSCGAPIDVGEGRRRCRSQPSPRLKLRGSVSVNEPLRAGKSPQIRPSDVSCALVLDLVCHTESFQWKSSKHVLYVIKYL